MCDSFMTGLSRAYLWNIPRFVRAEGPLLLLLSVAAAWTGQQRFQGQQAAAGARASCGAESTLDEVLQIELVPHFGIYRCC